jgi:hypothetical protein
MFLSPCAVHEVTRGKVWVLNPVLCAIFIICKHTAATSTCAVMLFFE